MTVTNHHPVRTAARGAGTVIPMLLFLLLLSSPLAAHATMSFDYVKNPSSKDMATFTGAINDRITTTDTPKTGYLYMQTSIKDTICSTQSVGIGGVTIIPNLDVKGYSSCYNFSPTITVNIAADNPDYGLTPYAQIGDYNINTNHISVIPYNYNVWQDQNYAADQNTANIFQMFVAQDRNPNLKRINNQKMGDIGNWVLDEGTFPALFEWKINNKAGVCNNQILTALNDKSTYYSHPTDLYISGYGTVTASNCKNLMMPNAGDIDRVNGMIDNAPEIINSLYYNEKLQYHSYPFVIKDIQLKCYNAGKLVGQRSLDIERQQNSIQSNPNGWTMKTRFQNQNGEEELSNGLQSYAWTTLRDGTTLYSPANIELYDKDFSLKCPVGTNYYTASVVIAKNYMYRQLSPLDATWHWNDVFPGTSGSVIETAILGHSTDEAIFITQTGIINTIPPPLNDTFPLNGNQDKNKINETNSTKAVTGTNNSYGTTPSNGNNGGNTCIDCMQNLTAGYGGNSTSDNGIAGNAPGGSSIHTGADDSAVTGLTQQAIGQNRIQTKASFMEKLIALGILILTTVIVIYAILSLILMMLLFFAIMRIPLKMKETLRDLFNAGNGK